MNLVERFEPHPRERVAIIAPSGSLTYGQLAERVGRWRGGLTAAGVNAGDRVAIVAGNDETFVLGLLAVIGIGAVAVPLNPASPVAELSRELDAVGATAVIAEMNAEVVLDGAGPRPVELETLNGAAPAPIVSVEESKPAVLLFTSGTAGMPKPAVLTHANLDASLRSMVEVSGDLLLSTHHIALAVIPLFHVFGLNAIVNLGLSVGATLVLEDFVNPDRVGRLVSEHGVTILAGPPTLWQALVASPSVEARALSSVVVALSGAAKLPPATQVAVGDRFGIQLAEGYGLTETCAILASSIATDAPIGSVGRPLPGVEVRLVDAEGSDVLVGDPGELWVRGPMVSDRYFDADAGPDAESLVRGDDEWLRTGDVAVVDDNGYLAIVDRLKDVVIVSGFNVFPGEVEAVLAAHPDVAQAGVVGEHHETTGEMLVAYLVALEGRKLDLDDITAHCRRELARYKVPSRMEVRPSLPVGIVGKLRRRELQ